MIEKFYLGYVLNSLDNFMTEFKIVDIISN
jgi:hypothetical protein